jgi:hypothetical protein
MYTSLLAQASVLLQQRPAEGVSVVSTVIGVIVAVVLIVAWWKIFTKAGKAGWAALIPIYNVIVMLQLIGRPVWWIILFFIPVVGFIIGIIVFLDLAKSFGRSTWFGIGLILLNLIFVLILAFGDAEYKGSAAA